MWKIGCCGFPRRREEYFRTFSVIEIQETFYQPPHPETLDRWRTTAPSEFEFTLKAWQVITHPFRSPTYRRLRERLARPEEAGFFRCSDTVLAAWERTRDAARRLGARIVLFQCPASFTPAEEHVQSLRAFFTRIDRGGLICVWEPRGDWPRPLVSRLCFELGLVHGGDPFLSPPATGGLGYFRLHGIGGFRYRYSNGDLHRLLEVCAGHEPLYCLFNNVSVFEDALRFRALVVGQPREAGT
jgi:uncharacterized protein YecE (DUF72 family)